MKDVNEYFKEVGRKEANEHADALEVKQALTMDREDYVAKEAESVTSALMEKYNLLLKQMQETSELLLEEMKVLPGVERKRIEEEFSKAQIKLEEAVDLEAALQESNFQAFLEITDPTREWLYGVGYNLFQEKKLVESAGVFQFLVTLSPMVRDYWVALGFVWEEEGFYDKAIEAFSFASILDPEHALSRYQSAQMYVHLRQFDDALAELKILKELIAAQNLDTFTVRYEELQRLVNSKVKGEA